MADTISFTQKTTFGNQKVLMGVHTAGGGAVATGLKFISCAQISPVSQNSAGGKTILINTAASGAGDIQVGESTSGDDHQIVIYGR